MEFVKSIGSNILPIKLQAGQELNAKVLKHITGTSSIYVKALEEINGREEVRMKITVTVTLVEIVQGTEGPLSGICYLKPSRMLLPYSF